MDTHADVVVAGAGLAGLACARALQAAGREVLVLEASDRPGGRLRSDVIDGVRIDRGFQVLLDSYGEARDQLDLDALRLRPFHPGALVWRGGRFRTVSDPRRRPGDTFATLLFGVGSLADKLRVLRLEARLRREPLGGSSADMLARERFGPEMLEGFLRPFLAGVFLERALKTSARRLAFVWRHFRDGHACLPAEGMQAIPAQLAAGLAPGSLRCDARVEGLEPGAVHVGGERVRAGTVVLATEEPVTRRLLDLPAGHAGRAVCCLHYAADASPVSGPWLVLGGDDDGPVNNLAVTSEVASEYAPAGTAAISVTVLGDPPDGDAEVDRAVRAQLRGWYGAQVDRWKLLRVDRVRHALPVDTGQAGALRSVAAEHGVELCGDHLEGASIQHALRSGRLLGERLGALAAST